jgi:hypothetical protein
VFSNLWRPTFQRCVLPPSSGQSLVDINLRTRQYIPEDSELHTCRHENLKSHKWPNIQTNGFYNSVRCYALFIQNSYIQNQTKNIVCCCRSSYTTHAVGNSTLLGKMNKNAVVINEYYAFHFVRHLYLLLWNHRSEENSPVMKIKLEIHIRSYKNIYYEQQNVHIT